MNYYQYSIEEIVNQVLPHSKATFVRLTLFNYLNKNYSDLYFNQSLPLSQKPNLLNQLSINHSFDALFGNLAYVMLFLQRKVSFFEYT